MRAVRVEICGELQTLQLKHRVQVRKIRAQIAKALMFMLSSGNPFKCWHFPSLSKTHLCCRGRSVGRNQKGKVGMKFCQCRQEVMALAVQLEKRALSNCKKYDISKYKIYCSDALTYRNAYIIRLL